MSAMMLEADVIKAVPLPDSAPKDLDPNVLAIMMTQGQKSFGGAFLTLISAYNKGAHCNGDSLLTVGLQSLYPVIGLDQEIHHVQMMDSSYQVAPKVRRALEAMILNIPHIETYMMGSCIKLGRSPNAHHRFQFAAWAADYQASLHFANMPPDTRQELGREIGDLAAKFGNLHRARNPRS